MTSDKECIIVDIDGTVADCSHRRKYVEQQPKDWDMFYSLSLVQADRVIESTAKIVRAMAHNYSILYVSGRRRELYWPTVNWLRKNNLWLYPNKLFMREFDDKRDDVTIKLEIWQDLKARGWKPLLVLDDRNRVVKMWRDQGLICHQVAEADF